MRKIILLLVFIPCLLNAQRLHVDLFGGFSNYQGDLQDKTFTTEQAKGAVGLGLKYDLTPHFSLRTNFTYASLSAADKYNRQADLRARNLSFQTKITEGNFLVDYSLYNLENYKITPYVFAGLAVFHFNPYAYDSAGNKTYLHPLGTEGQGLAGYNRKAYHLTQLAIPFGIGVRWKFTENITLSYEVGWRKSSTDYLDDVSSTYVDQNLLAATNGAKAVEMAYRGGELKTGQPYPADGSIRGGSRLQDWYYFSGINISIGINNGKRLHGFGKGRGSTACPPRVM